jgi:SAM-dependent methyltransferase
VDARGYERSVAPLARARHGLFYTPDALADRVAWAALAEWLAQRGVPFDEAWALFASGRAPRASRQLVAAREWLGNLTVLDPSCGGGALLAATERATSRAARAIGEPSNARLLGTDRDPVAIALARALLSPRATVAKADALAPAGPTADVVLTNPPYGPPEVRGDIDRYVTFWRAAAARVRPGGVLAVLAPTSWRTGRRYDLARRTVIEASGVSRVLLVPAGAFADAYVDTCITLCRVGEATRKPIVMLLDLGQPDPPSSRETHPVASSTNASPTLADLFMVARGILAPSATGHGEPLLLGPVAAFAWPTDRRSFARVDPDDVREGRASLAFAGVPRLLVRRIVGRSERLTCLVSDEPAVVKKDFYVLVPRDPSVSLHAYAALLHARPVARAIAAHEVAATKNDFAQLTLAVLRDLHVPRLVRPGEVARRRAETIPDESIDPRGSEVVSAWLEARALEGRRIGRALLDRHARHPDADRGWKELRARLDAFVARLLAG